MTPNRSIAALVLAAVALSACGGVGDDGPGSGPAESPSASPSTTGIGHGTNPDDLILRFEFTGGFVMPDYYLKAVPSWSLYGDGTLIVPGPQIEIYPPPLLPNLQARQLDEEAVQAVLEAAREAGLQGPDREYTAASQYIADAATTVFTIEADGERHQTSVYAMSEADPSFDVPQEERDAREALSDLQEKLTSLDSWLPEGSIGPEHAYEAASLRILVSDDPPATDEAVEQKPVDWPLEDPLAKFGSQEKDAFSRCGVVSGPDAEKVLEVAAKSTELTPWRDGGKSFGVAVRPLLPDEEGCPT